jgi:hypothetical protein
MFLLAQPPIIGVNNMVEWTGPALLKFLDRGKKA